MPIILMLPNHLDELFTKAKLSPDVTQAIINKIYMLDERAHFKKKFFGSKIVYSINANADGAHRLLFELVENELGSVFVLRDIAFHHNYRKALKWRPFGNISSDELLQLGYAINQSNIDIDVNTIEELPPAILYQDNWLDLTQVQSQTLAQTTFPQSIIGPPGSGKTLVSLAFFQEQALHHQAEDQGLLKLLYITEHSELKLSIEGTWKNWARHELAKDKAHVQAIFLSFSELNEWYAREINPNITVIDIEGCLDRLKQLSKHKTLIKPSLILDELIQSAHLLNDDLKNGRNYADSSYRAGGINQTTLPLNDKEIIYELYQRLNAQLKKDNAVFLEFVSIGACPAGYEYDFIGVDEAQNSSMLNLLNAFAMVKNNKVIYCGDSYQRSNKKVSSLELLEPELYKKGVRLIQSTLPITHRLQPSVAHLCENLILLENNLRGGLPDNTSYPSFASALKEEPECSLNFVTTYNDSYKAIGENAQSAALVINSKDISEAKILIGGQNVFLSSNAQGLQFEQIFLYLSKETQKAFYELNQKMIEKNISLETTLNVKLNASPTKGKSNQIDLSVLSDLFIALSRSTGNVYLYLEKTDNKIKHKLSRFLPWLMNECRGKNEVVTKESSLQEWLTTINLLINNNHLTQAKDNLSSVFKLSFELAQGYINYYQAQSNKDIDIEDHMAWLTQSMIPSPKSTKPLSTKKSTSRQKKRAELSQKTLPTVLEKQSLPQKEPDISSELIKASAQKPLDSSGSIGQFKPLSKKHAQYVESFFKSIDNQTNIEHFLAGKHLENMLFCHKMENGLCLWVNIIFNHSIFVPFNAHLQTISQKKPGLTFKIARALFQVSTFAQSHNDTILQLTLGVITASPNYDLTIENLPPLEQIIKNIRGTGRLNGFTQLFSLAKESGASSLIQFIINEWSVLTPHLIWQDLVRYQTPGFVTQNNGFIISVVRGKNFHFLEENIGENSIIKALSKDLLTALNPLDTPTTHLFHEFYNNEQGATFLANQWSVLAPYVDMRQLSELCLSLNKSVSNSLLIGAQRKLEMQMMTFHIKEEIENLHSAQGDKIKDLLVYLYQTSACINTHVAINKYLDLSLIYKFLGNRNSMIKQTSICLLANLVETHEKKDEITGLIIPHIVALLQSKQVKDQGLAINALTQLSQINKDCPHLKECELLHALFNLMDSAAPALLKRILFLLTSLLDNKKNANTFIQNQAMGFLIAIINSENIEITDNAINIMLMLLENYYLEFVDVGIASILIILDLKNEQIKHKAALALRFLMNNSTNEIEKREIVKLLIERLDSSSVSIQTGAACCIANLSNTKEMLPLLNCIGSLTALLVNSKKLATVKYACHALAKLAFEHNNQEIIRQCNAIAPLITLLKSPDVELRLLSARAMHLLAMNYKNKQVITELLGIEALFHLLADEDNNNRAYACSALASIAELRSSHERFHQLNAMNALFNLLNASNTKALSKSKALNALSLLVKTQVAPLILTRSDELKELINFSSSSKSKDKNNASQLLCALAVNEQNRKIIFEEISETVINILLSANNLDVQKQGLIALANYTDKNSFFDESISHQVLQKTINILNTAGVLASQEVAHVRGLCLQILINSFKLPAQRCMVQKLKNLSSFLSLLNKSDLLILSYVLELWALLTSDQSNMLYRCENDLEKYIKTLIHIITSSKEAEQVTLQAVTIISNISDQYKIKNFIDKTEGLKVLIPLLTAQSFLIQQAVMKAIKNLITFHFNNLETVIALDGINLITSLAASSNPDIKKLAEEILLLLPAVSSPKASSAPQTLFFSSPNNDIEGNEAAKRNASKEKTSFNFKI